VGDVDGLNQGVYHYEPHKHELLNVLNGDMRADLAKAALNLVTVTIGAFDDSQIKEALNLLTSQETLYIMPVGRK